jgi:gliding motility associated protien GldN
MKKLGFILLTIGFFLGLANEAGAQMVMPRDGVYDKQHTREKKPLPYTHLREADVMWERRVWRVIDFREKMNQGFYYPETPHNDWKSFMQMVWDAVREGEITAYDITNTDEFLVPLSFKEIEKRLNKADSMQMQRDYPPYDWYDTVIYEEFTPMDVKKIRIKEDWFFDRQRSQMDVRILGICPVKEDKDEFGMYRGDQPLFWIYFPEARNVFARTEFFNRQNRAERRTYDEVFWKRFFSSYIYKVDNVYDRRVTDYATGIDALYEAERLKMELFEFEHDLWEF